MILFEQNLILKQIFVCYAFGSMISTFGIQLTGFLSTWSRWSSLLEGTGYELWTYSQFYVQKKKRITLPHDNTPILLLEAKKQECFRFLSLVCTIQTIETKF